MRVYSIVYVMHLWLNSHVQNEATQSMFIYEHPSSAKILISIYVWVFFMQLINLFIVILMSLCEWEDESVYLCLFSYIVSTKIAFILNLPLLVVVFFLTVQRLHIFCFCKQFLLFVFLRNLFKCAAIEAAIKFSDSMIRWFTGTFPLVHTH